MRPDVHATAPLSSTRTADLRPHPRLARACLRSVTAPVATLLAVTCVLALLLSAADADEPEGDTVVLLGGEAVPCEVVSEGVRIVRVRIGDAVYALERSGLKEVTRHGRVSLDPEWTAFVGDLADRLSSADERIATAARTGLEALGESALPYLQAALKDDRVPSARRALDALVAAIDGSDKAAEGDR